MSCKISYLSRSSSNEIPNERSWSQKYDYQMVLPPCAPKFYDRQALYRFQETIFVSWHSGGNALASFNTSWWNCKLQIEHFLVTVGRCNVYGTVYLVQLIIRNLPARGNLLVRLVGSRRNLVINTIVNRSTVMPS